MGGKGMAEGVGGNFLDSGEVEDVAVNDSCHAATGKPAAAGIEKKRGKWRRQAAGCQVGNDRLSGKAAKRDDPLLAAFTENPDQPTLQINPADIKPGQLRNPDTAGIEGFKNRPVAESKEVTLSGRLHQGGYFVDIEVERKSFLLLRCAYQFGRVYLNHSLAEQIFEKSPDRGKHPADGAFPVVFMKKRQVAADQKMVYIRRSSILSLFLAEEFHKEGKVRGVGFESVRGDVSFRAEIGDEPGGLSPEPAIRPWSALLFQAISRQIPCGGGRLSGQPDWS